MHKITTTLFSFLFLLCAFCASAQDKIITRDGDELAVKVKEITPSIIRYQKVDDGPIYTIPRRDVSRIVYESGVEETFETGRRGPGRPGMNDRTDTDRTGRNGGSNGQYGSNVISLALIQMTDRSVAGMGLRYEHVMDQRGLISVVLPVAFSMAHNDNNNNYNFPNTSSERTYRLYTYFYPGVRFYPAGSKRGFAYAVGPSLVFGTGKVYGYSSTYDPVTQQYSGFSHWYDNTRMGVMINNSLNFMPTRHLSVGLELGLGFLYLDNYGKGYTNHNNLTDAPIANFNFTMGYRF